MKGDNIFVKKRKFQAKCKLGEELIRWEWEYCCNLFLGPRTKKRKKINRKNNNNEKSMLERLENDKKLVEEVQKYKDRNLTVYR